MAATSVFAQSTVEISGNVDVAAGVKEATNGLGKSYAKSTGVMDGFNAPNRIFIKVTEDLGGGMKFMFQNEHGISPTNTQDWATRQNNGAPTVNGTSGDASATTADTQIPMMGFQTAGTNRGTFLALQGGFGEIRAGYLVGHGYNLAAQSGYFYGSENYGALLQNTGLGEVGGTRANGIEFKSAKVANAFTFGVQKQYGAERTTTSDAANAPYTTKKAERVSFRVDYNNGPLNAGYVRTNYDADSQAQVGGAIAPTASVFGVAGTAITTTVVATNATQKNTSDILNASYAIGDVKVAYQYNKAKVDSTIDANDRTLKSSQIGVNYAMGAASVFVITGKGYNDSSSARINDIKNTQYGVRYAMSKRTTAYFMAGTSKDSATTTAALASKGTFSGVGLAHSF